MTLPNQDVFSDSELRKLKLYLAAEKEIPGAVKIGWEPNQWQEFTAGLQALLARLDAAEAVVTDYLELYLHHHDAYPDEPNWKAWRKKAGRD